MEFLGGSLWIARLWGINVRVHFLFLLFIGMRLFQAGAAWQTQLWFSAMLFGIILVHEFGHCFGARSVGGDAREILLWPLGGLAFAHAPMTPWAQFVTVAAGPLVNLIFCIISAAVIVGLTGTADVLQLNPLTGSTEYNILKLTQSRLVNNFVAPPLWLHYVGLFFDVNLWLLAFNLLPIYPMDGGQLFQVAMWPKLGLRKSTEIACQVGLLGCVGLGMWGLSTGNGGMAIMLAIFGGMTCWQRLQAAKYGALFDDRMGSYESVNRYRRTKTGMFGGRGRAKSDDEPEAAENPNPGGWEAKQREATSREDEIDRILKKVHEQGITSLTYVERQTLERATRERQADRR